MDTRKKHGTIDQERIRTTMSQLRSGWSTEERVLRIQQAFLRQYALLQAISSGERG